MDASRPLAQRRALRLAAYLRWSTQARLALAFAARRPMLWLIGAIGFNLRGGIVLLTVPMVVIPSLGEVRLLVGDNLGTNGLRPEFVYQLVLAAGVVGLLVLGGLALVARAEIDAFAALIGDPLGAELLPRPAVASATLPIRRLMLEVLGVQVAATAVLVLAGVPLLGAIYASVVAQVVQPTGDGDIYLRVLSDVGQPLLAFLAVAVALEMLVALLTRVRLRVAFGLGGMRHMAMLRQPLRVLATAAVGWLVSVTALAAAVLLMGTAFGQARAAMLAPAAGDPTAQLVGQLIVSFGLAAAVAAAIALTGFASALRSAFWNVTSLD